MVRLYDTKLDSVEEDEEYTHPFRMTKAEIQSLDPNYKEKKKKVSKYVQSHISHRKYL